MKLPPDFAGANHQNNNLFLAFLPEDHARPDVHEFAKEKRMKHGFIGKPLGLPQYHVSLHSFGSFAEISPDLISWIGEVAAPLAAATEPFTLNFDRALTFDTRRSKLPFVLRSSEINEPLMEFYRKLRERVKESRSAFTPHITLLYDAKNISEHSIPPLGWRVSELVLVRSLVGLGRHEHPARWPLQGCSSRSVQMKFLF